MRRQAIVMAQNTYTPISFWLSMPIREFTEWIKELNELVRQREKDRK